MQSKMAVVVTSISAPNAALRELAGGCRDVGIPFLVIGDVKSPVDFALDLDGGVRGRREDKDEDARRVDGFDDHLREVVARQDVARSDPATDLVAFERCADCVADRLVVRRVADEHIVRQAMPPRRTDARLQPVG